MLIVCIKCKKTMGMLEGRDGIKDGICVDCMTKRIEEIELRKTSNESHKKHKTRLVVQ